MKKIIFFTAILAFVLSACGETITPQPLETTVVPATETQLPSTATSRPPTPTKIVRTDVPTEITTPGPVIDPQGNVSWHPQEVLVLSDDGCGYISSYRSSPGFVLLWDGTLLQRGYAESGPPFISHLDQDEMCKILNTVDESGFWDEQNDYDFPFFDLERRDISVNAWKSNHSGSQILSEALSGAPYYESLFCGNCPMPSEETVIRPGLANVYFFLKNYMPENRKVAPVDKLRVYFASTDQEPTHRWPLTSAASAELATKCQQTACMDAEVFLDGAVAKEIYRKIKGDEVFMVESIMGSVPFRVEYRVAWPYEVFLMCPDAEETQLPKPPADYTLTCGPDAGRYPILPLSKDNKYWYYSPDGEWGAEVVEEPGQFPKVRVVNKSGYEKYYQYDPSLFNQSSLKVFPRFWTKDGEYFLVNVLPGDFETSKAPLVNSIGLQRISITDGQISYLFAGIEGQAYAYTLSENGGQVAYIRQSAQPLKIVIKNTYSGKEKAAALAIPINGTGSYIDAGTLVWSVDEKTLYVAATYRENDVDAGRLISVDVSNPAKQNILYESAEPFKLMEYGSGTYRNVGICPLESERESSCDMRLDPDGGTIYEQK